jgi:two-component system, cell cycle response regulator DivK
MPTNGMHHASAQPVFSVYTPQSVLVVDDLRDMRELYKEFLDLNGFQVVQAANGIEALSVAQSVRPAAIVMDLEMPAMGGSEATRALKQDERTKSIPIIVLTGSSRESQLSEAKAAGCAALLRKPCMPEVLLEAIRHVLRGEPVPNDLALG